MSCILCPRLLKKKKKKKKKRKNLSTNCNLRTVGIYAWVVLGAMFVANILTAGYVKSFGLIYNAVQDSYPGASGTMAGVMVGLLSGCRSLFSPLVGTMANAIGIRGTMCMGAALFFASLICSYFCNTVMQLAFTLGAMAGLSHCIIETCQVVVIPQYFQFKIPIANGIRVAGNPCGAFLYPLMLTFLLHFCGLRLMFIILAGITSHIFISAFLIRPICVHTRIKALDMVRNFDFHESCKESCTLAPSESCTLLPNEICFPRDKDVSSKTDMLPNEIVPVKSDRTVKPFLSLKDKGSHNASGIKNKMDLYNKIVEHNENVFQRKSKKPLNFGLLRNPQYLLFIVLASGISMGAPLVLYYTTLYAKTSAGLTPYEITVMLSFQAIYDFVLRIFIGWFSSKDICNKTHVFIFCLWCSAAGSLLMPLGKSLVSIMAIVSLHTLGAASFYALTNVILCEQFGSENIATSWGFVRMTQGIFSFIHPIIIGHALDKSGAYTIPFLLMGIGLFICGLAMGVEAYMERGAKPRTST